MRYDQKTRDRFFAKTVRAANGCLEWTGCVKKPTSQRYSGGRELPHGMFKLEGKKVGAHRVAKALELDVDVATLPLIGHECDNPRCVDHRHLTLSDHSTNLKEAYDRGRRNLPSLLAWFESNPITLEAAE